MLMENTGSEFSSARRGRGRPRKFPLAEPQPRRGRPPKTPPAGTDAEKQIVMFKDLKDSRIVSLEAAALHCKVTGRTMKLYFEKYFDLAASAIVSRGAKGVDSWQIDLEALDRWRHQTGYLVHDDGELGENGPTRRRVSSTERRAALQADMLEMRIARDRGEVLDKTEVYSKLRTAFAHVAKGLDNMPQKLGAVCNLPGDVIEKMRDQLDLIRRALVMEIQDMMEPLAPVPEKPYSPDHENGPAMHAG